MKQATQYDTNGDGICDVDACKDVLMINRSSPPQVDMTPILTADLAKIGITLKARELDTSTAYTTSQTVNKLIPIGANAGWGKDYADPSTFAVLFQSSGIDCNGLHQLLQRRHDRCAGEGVWRHGRVQRGGGARSDAERRQRDRPVQQGLRRRADAVLDQARPGPHGERGSVGARTCSPTPSRW